MSAKELKFLQWLLIPVLIITAQIADSDRWYVLLPAIVGFSMALLGYGELSVLIEQRRRMPYRWQCKRCTGRIGMESSDEGLLQRFREDHNRTVHLQEP